VKKEKSEFCTNNNNNVHEKSYDHYFNLVHVENVDKQRRQFTSENDVVAKERKETNKTRRITNKDLVESQ